MLIKVISGFQTGADSGGIMAALACGIPTGGWMTKGYRTEAGCRPDFALKYGAQQHASADYPPRTYANVHDSDATIWFGQGDSAGYRCTFAAVAKMNKLKLVIRTTDSARSVADWIISNNIMILNVAGNRESASPGIALEVRDFLIKVFTHLGYEAN